MRPKYGKSMDVLAGEIGEGDTVLVDVDGESLTFRAVSTPDPVLAEPD